MILIDGNNLCWKSYFAAPLLQSQGRSTGVLHAGLMMLSSLARIVEPQRIVFLWDSAGGSWRSSIFPEYKRNRKVDPELRGLVYSQIAVFRKILSVIGISQLAILGLEADDLAGCFVSRNDAPSEGFVLVSGDKDWLQLIGPNVVVLQSWKGKSAAWMNERWFQETYRIQPNQWPLVLALSGDAVDNIPGVRRGLGPKTALKIIRENNIAQALSAEEFAVYERNVMLTTILRKSPKAWVCNHAPRTQEGWGWFSACLRDYELHEIRTRREKIWEMGGWGRASS